MIFFDRRRIPEMNTHQELRSLGGIYFKLYQLQYKEQEVGLADYASMTFLD